MHLYVATSYKANGVVQALTLRKDSGKTSALLATQHIDSVKLHDISPEGSLCRTRSLTCCMAPPLLLIRVPQSATDHLLLIDKELNCFYIDPRHSAQPVATGSLVKSDAVELLSHPFGFSSRRVLHIVVHLYKGLLQVVPVGMAGPEFSDAFTVRTKEENLLELVDLSAEELLVGMLCKDELGNVKFRTYELCLRVKDFAPPKPIWKIRGLDPTCHRATAISPSVLALFSAEKAFIYGFLKTEPSYSLALPLPGTILASTALDDKTLLLGSSTRRLYRLSTAGTSPVCETLATTPYPSTLAAFTSNGGTSLYVGSLVDNSVLLDLGTGKALAEHENLGCVEDLLKVGDRIVACSNHLEYSCIQELGKGFGFHSLCTLPIKGLCDVWTAALAKDATYVVLSFVAESKLLRLDAATLALVEVQTAAFHADRRTMLFATAKQRNLLLYCTETEVALVSVHDTGELTTRSILSAKAPLLHVAATLEGDCVATCEADMSIHVYHIEEKTGLEEDPSFLVPPSAEEVAALGITSTALVVSYWSRRVRVYRRDLHKTSVEFAAESLVRSIETVGSGNKLICGTADGSVLAYENLAAEPKLCSQLGVGVGPVKLCRVLFGDSHMLAACCETTTMIKCDSEDRLHFHPANFCAQTVSVSLFPFSTDCIIPPVNCCYIPGVLFLSGSQDSLAIGLVQDPAHSVRKSARVHGIQAKKLLFDEAENVVVVLADSNSPSCKSQILVFDAASLVLLYSTAVDPRETATSILCFSELETKMVPA